MKRCFFNFFAGCSGRNCSRNSHSARVRLFGFVLSTGMALAKTMLRKQQKVGEQYAERYIVFDNAGSSLQSNRGVRLFNG